MRLRPTDPDDLPALYGIFAEAIGAVYRSHGFTAPIPSPEVFFAQQRHVLETGTGVVAEDGGRLGFAAAWRRGDDWFLASLFVRPDAQGRGVGTTLLDAVWGPEALRRRAISDAIQPVSNALYVRRGLIPVTPIFVFDGEPSSAPATELEPGEFDAQTLAAIDLAAYGFDRAVDHRYWERLAPRREWLRDGAPVAYGYSIAGHVGPVAGVDAAAAAAALRAGLTDASGAVRVRIPGASRALVAAAVESGLRLGAAPQLLLVSADADPPATLAIAGATLF